MNTSLLSLFANGLRNRLDYCMNSKDRMRNENGNLNIVVFFLLRRRSRSSRRRRRRLNTTQFFLAGTNSRNSRMRQKSQLCSGTVPVVAVSSQQTIEVKGVVTCALDMPAAAGGRAPGFSKESFVYCTRIRELERCLEVFCFGLDYKYCSYSHNTPEDKMSTRPTK